MTLVKQNAKNFFWTTFDLKFVNRNVLKIGHEGCVPNKTTYKPSKISPVCCIIKISHLQEDVQRPKGPIVATDKSCRCV